MGIYSRALLLLSFMALFFAIRPTSITPHLQVPKTVLTQHLYSVLPKRLLSAHTSSTYAFLANMSSDALPEKFIPRHVARAVQSIETAEGVGARVRRSIGTPALRNFSPFLMLDLFHIPPGAGFEDHPHRGMTTVTLMKEGIVQHEDFEGNAGTIGVGDLQWMTAGKGIMHAEMPLHHDPKTGERLPDPKGLQLWIDLPQESRYTEPTYQDLRHEQIPVAKPRSKDVEDPEREGQGWEVKVIAGKSREYPLAPDWIRSAY